MIFLDASFLIAFFLRENDYLDSIDEIEDIIKYEKYVINNTVITEVLNTFKIPNDNFNPKNILEAMLKLHIVDYLSPKDNSFKRIFSNYYGQAINFSDCTILRTMEKYDIDTIVSFDDDFDKINGIKRIF